MPVSPSRIWSWMPPTRLATTGAPFHMASATVSPNPSARLFCTTTVARRWSALTIAAFSAGSSIGRDTRCTRARMSSGSAARRASTSSNTSSPSGSSVTAATAGPAIRRWASVRGAMPSHEPGEHAGRILEPVPARYLHDERNRSVDLGGAAHVGHSVHPAGGAVLAQRTRRPRSGTCPPRCPRSEGSRSPPSGRGPGSWPRRRRSTAGSPPRLSRSR